MEYQSETDRIGVARPADGEGFTIAELAERDCIIERVDRDILNTLRKGGGMKALADALLDEWHPGAVRDVMRSFVGSLFPARDCQRNQSFGPPKREPSVYASSFSVYQKETEVHEKVQALQVADPDAFRAQIDRSNIRTA